MKKTFWIYGLFLGLLLFCFKFSEYWFWYHHNNFDLFIAFVVAISMVLGVWLGYRKKAQKEPFQTVFSNQTVEEIHKSNDNNEIKNTLIGTISKREMQDQALDNMQRQIERYKGKHQHGRGDGRSAAEAAEPIIDDETGELSPLVARKKKFILYPMSEDEAVVQMRNLGHDNFFIFYNADTSKINVLYRRRNGSYGLIEPELG